MNGPITGASLSLLADFSGRTVTLAASNSYTANTTISGGTLLLNNGYIYGTGGVVVNGGGTLAGNGTIRGIISVTGGSVWPGNGTGIAQLTSGGGVTLAGTVVMDINAATHANDVIAAPSQVDYSGGTLTVTNLDGALDAPATFVLFSSTNYLNDFSAFNLPTPASGYAWAWTATNGTLALVAGVSTTPTNITAAVSGSTLTLSWPADHIGWRLLEQTNHLALGISLVTNDWTALPGSEATNSVSITIDYSKPTEFYRLIYP